LHDDKMKNASIQKDMADLYIIYEINYFKEKILPGKESPEE